MRRILVSLSLIAVCAGSTYAQEPVALSLQAAMDYAVKNNAQAKNARLDVLIQDAQNKQTTSIALPQLNAKGDYTGFFNVQKAFVPGEFIGAPGTFVPVAFTPKYASSAGATASQILFDGSVLVALQAREAVMALAKSNSQLTDESIKYNVQRAYYALVIAKRQLNILSSSLAYARDIARDISILRENGYAEKIDVDRTNVQVNNLATDSLRISSLLIVSEQALKYQMGMDINAPIVLTDTSLERTISENTLLADNAIDYTKRTEYQLLQTQQELNNYNLKRYRLAALPSLAAVGSLGYNFGTNTFSQLFEFRKYYQFYSFMALQLNVPIFSGFKRTNQVKEAKINIDKTNNSIDNLKLTINFQNEQARTTLKNSLLQLQSQQRNLQLANSVIDLARKKYKAGVGSNLEVSQAQTELLNAQNNYFNSLLEVVNAQTELQRALGNFK
jgi:outer membrane protein